MGRHVCPNACAVDGNNGGSYIILRDDGREGFVWLEVGETCVTTVRQEISVVALSAILTWARNYGFERILSEYGFEADDGWAVDKDPIVSRRAAKK